VADTPRRVTQRAGDAECSFAKAITLTVLAVKGSTNVVIGGHDGELRLFNAGDVSETKARIGRRLIR
jgi:hypothetical protein